MKYFRNTSWLFAEKILRMIVGLFVGIWIARYLGPEQFGLFSYAQSFVGLFTAIATLGLDGIVVRELVKSPEKQNELLGTSFILKLFGAIITLLVLAIAINFTSNDSYTNTLIFIIASATIFQSFNVIDFYFQAKVLSKYVVFANIFSLFVSSLIKIYLIINEAELEAFALVILFDSVVLASGFIYFYLKQDLSIRKWEFDKDLAIDLLKDSWSLIFGAVAASIYMQIDQIMIKEILGNSAVGYYSVAVRLSSLWLFITVTMTSSLYPSIINAKEINNQLYLDKIQLQYNILMKIAFIISVSVYLSSEFIVIFLYGNEYTESIKILDIYIWSIIFVYLSNGSWSYYLNENLQKLASMRLIYGAFLNIFLNIFLIKYFGLIGAAYSTIISYAISSYLINYLYVKTRMNFKLQTKAIINIFHINSWKKPLNNKGV